MKFCVGLILNKALLWSGRKSFGFLGGEFGRTLSPKFLLNFRGWISRGRIWQDFVLGISLKFQRVDIFVIGFGINSRLSLMFTPLEKATDFNRWSSPIEADGGLKPPSAQTVRERSSLTGFTLFHK